MCDPTAMMVMGNIVKFGEDQQRAAANTKAANAAYLSDTRQLNLQQREYEEAEAQRSFDADLQAARDTSKAMTAAGESGVSGLSVDALMNDILRQNLFDDNKANSNLNMGKAQIAQEKEGAKAGRQSRINQVPYPSFASTALQIGGGMYEGGYFQPDATPFKGGAGR